MKRALKLLLLAVICFVVPLRASAEAPKKFPGDSVYAVSLPWTDDAGKKGELSQFAGKYVVLTFIYTHCQASCPLTIGRLKSIQDELDAKHKTAEIAVVSMDADRDTPEVLAAFRKEQKLDRANWHFFWGPDENVRTLSSILGGSYQKTKGGMEFMHSNMIHLLGPDGRIVEVMEGFNKPVPEFVAPIK